MASGFWGADAGELRALAKDFDQKAGQLSGVLSTLTTAINGTSAWTGPDAAIFRQEWNGVHRSSLVQANAVLLAAASALVKNADEQEQASAADGGSGPGGSGPGGTGPGGTGPGGTGPGGTGSDPSGPGADGVPGTADDDYGLSDLYLDIFDSPLVNSMQDHFDVVGVLGGLDAAAQLRLLGSFRTLDGALDFTRAAGTFHTLTDFLGGQNWGPLAQGASNLVGDGALAARLGSAAELLGSAGKVLGPVGIALGVVSVGTSIVKGDYVRAGYDAVSTGLGVAALVTPPPVNLALGLAAGGMALGGLLYDNVPVFHDAVDATGEFIGDAAEAVGDAVSDAGSAIADGAEDFANGVAEAAEDLWPF
ncbi:MAG: hypothetical protein Q7T71_09615 [Herbiconiux sp.]|nr:hypothetical protein [Herbiconiux sp.]